MPDDAAGPRKLDGLFLALAVFLSIGGLAAFVYLFVLDFNLYWLILSPVILALYQLPATFFYWLHKRARRRAEAPRGGPGPAVSSSGGPPDETPPAG
jgi:hypothetical protein